MVKSRDDNVRLSRRGWFRWAGRLGGGAAVAALGWLAGRGKDGGAVPAGACDPDRCPDCRIARSCNLPWSPNGDGGERSRTR